MPDLEADDPGDLLIRDARIHPHAHASPVAGMLVRSGRIVAVGDPDALACGAHRKHRVVSLEGASVTPGFTDSHVHLTMWAVARSQVELTGCGSAEAVAARVATAPADSSGWVLGWGWSAGGWARPPTRHDLDRVAPDRPVLLDSHDLHGAWLNSRALELCGIGADTADPTGGVIVRDPGSREPTGVVLEAARMTARARLPVPGRDAIRTALLLAQRELHALGLTGIHSVEMDGLRDFADLRAADDLTLRVAHYVPPMALDEAIAFRADLGMDDDFLRVVGIKLFLDGALGSRTAWLRAAYETEPGYRGVRTMAGAEVREAAEAASASGLATAAHAIGDAAVEMAIGVLGEVAAPLPVRHRIEHVQLAPPDLWARMAAAGLVASMQPVHLLTDLDAADREWGARSAHAFPVAGLHRAGVTLAFGSDVPVESPDPRPGLFAAVARSDWSGYRTAAASRTWHPAQRIDAATAIAAYTEGPADAVGVGHRRGRLLLGFDADFTVWDRDPYDIDPAGYPTMNCLMTFVGGRLVHGSAP